MREYYITISSSHKKEKDHEHCHFAKEEAEKVVSKIYYTDKAGVKHKGAHWTIEQIETATTEMKFPEGTTEYDRFVGFNSFYADTCKVLDEASILKTAHAFYFEDEDAPKGKIKKYIDAMYEH